MSTDRGDADKLKAERRAFLEKCGRFAAVTPPVVTLMLAVSDKSAKAQLATSQGGTTTTTTSTTTTPPTTTTDTTVPPTTTTTDGPPPTTTTTVGLMYAPTHFASEEAHIIDGMGLRKLT